MHISSSYAKILGEKLFRTWEIPRSGLKAEDGGEERLNNGENNGQATHGATSTCGARKPPGPKVRSLFTTSPLKEEVVHFGSQI